MSRTAAILIVAGVTFATFGSAAWRWRDQPPTNTLSSPRYVGSQTCAKCHQVEFGKWKNSHHDRAMEIATDETVLGNFDGAVFERFGVTTRFYRRDGKYFVNAEGPDGHYHDYEVRWTFGVEPLQQYMVELPRGRIQVLRVAWNTRKNEWFEVTPPDAPNERFAHDDPAHWTGIAQNWNSTCAECHSTDLQKNYDFETDAFHTTFAEIDVSCEECHGPGSAHVEMADRWWPLWGNERGYGLAKLKGDDPTAQIETCAKCHSHRHAIRPNFRPGEPFLDYFEPALLIGGLYHDNGQIDDEVYEYGSFLQSKMHAQRVRCTDCHNPHSLQLKFTGNQLCTQCHLPAKYDTLDHHHHPSGSTGASCIECHMPMRTYMVVDDRRDHGFRVPRPDLSVTLGTPNACIDCHTKPNETSEWAAAKVREWYGDMRRDDPHWTAAIAAGNRGLPNGDELLAEVIARPDLPAIVRATAVNLTGQYLTEASIAAQLVALEDPNPLVRAEAVRVLSGGKSKDEVVRLLGERLSDPIRAVRLAAARRLLPVGRESLPEQFRGPFDRAVIEFREAQQLTLERAHSHINLGWLALQLGNTDEAAKQFRDAIRVEPYLTGPRTELANLLARESGDTAEVRRLRQAEVELLERDADLLPDSADTHYRLGLILFQLAEHAAAASALQKACDLAPASYQYRMALALIQERQFELDTDTSHFDAAMATLRALREISPEDPRSAQIQQRLMSTKQQRDSISFPNRSFPAKD
jgi:predicted CXXCH cytochrome family protein